MKPFFKSQKFIQKNSDGSIEFYVSYTQTLEILPFIKQWSPSIQILEPKALIETYTEELEAALTLHQ